MNNDKDFKILQPKYYSQFQCDPIKCHESCCEGWKITIDKSTYEKYIQSENGTIKEIVKKGLSINEASINEDDFAIINLNKEMACPFLNQNNHCEIFIHMGEGSLSKTCKSYPRGIVLVKNRVERGLEMSCSVAAELALLNDNGIEFEDITDNVNFNNLYVVSLPIEDLKQIEIINEIRTTLINILKSRRFGLSERVGMIGYFLNQVAGIVEMSDLNYEEIFCRIKEEKISMNFQQVKAIKNKYQLKNRRPFHHLNTMLSMKFKEGNGISFISKRFIACLMEVLEVFANVENTELEKHYKTNYDKYVKPYLDKKGYILENYLVNYVFVYSSELFSLNDIWTSYLKLCVVYGLIKFNLVGLAIYNKGMNDDLMLKLIQSISKTIIPDKKYMKSVIQYLKEEKLDEYTKLTTLIAD